MNQARFPNHVVQMPSTVQEVASDGRPLAFVHINKTAGTSFTQYLRAHFPDESAVAPPFYGDMESLELDDPRRRLFWGHFTYAQFYDRCPQAWFITFLRDPVQRLISQYRSLHNPANLSGGWERVLPAHARAGLEFAQQASFEEFVMSEDPFIEGHLRDLQTRFLSSHSNREHPNYLSSAIRNLSECFLFFGITEAFQDSIQLFRYQLQSSVDYRAKKFDRNKSRLYDVESKDSAVRQRIEELLTNDRRLYDFARHEFAARVMRMQQGQQLSAHEAA